MQDFYTISTSEFNRPEVIRGPKGQAFYVMQLLLMEKGTNPLKPEMGVGLISNYRFTNINKNALENDLKDQVNTYLPEVNFSGLDLIIDADNTAHIRIRIDNTVYDFPITDAIIPEFGDLDGGDNESLEL